MDLWTRYKASLKPLEVEEPIDVYVHRPLGFILALVCMPTPVSPNLLTVFSIFVGLGAAVCLVVPFPWHMQIGGLLIFLSAVVDCSDGQLARMRKSSSVFGRMLDGVADLIVTSAVVPATGWVIWQMYQDRPWVGAGMVLVAALSIVTSSFHTSMYDHYKNVFLAMTYSGHGEGEDAETAQARWDEQAARAPWWKRLSWRIYLFYLRSQQDFVRKFDSCTTFRFGLLPSVTASSASVYRKHNASVMRLWRGMFGFGTMIFGLALFNAIERPDVYVVLRLFLFNAVFFLFLRPRQRLASRGAFTELGLRLPDQKDCMS